MPEEISCLLLGDKRPSPLEWQLTEVESLKELAIEYMEEKKWSKIVYGYFVIFAY